MVTTDDVTGFTNTIAFDRPSPRSCSSALIIMLDATDFRMLALLRKRLRLPSVYDRKSVAEKNSIAVAWEFMRPDQ
jgi:hypothetical protein